jgi:hypothetical protein
MKNLLVKLIGLVWFLMVSAYWISRVSLKTIRLVAVGVEQSGAFVRKGTTRGLIGLVFWRRRKERSLTKKTVSVQESFKKENEYVTSSGKEIKVEAAS